MVVMIRIASHKTNIIPRPVLPRFYKRSKVVQVVLTAVSVVAIQTSCTSEESAPVFQSDTGVSKTSTENKLPEYTDGDSAQDEPDSGSSMDCIDRETLFDLAVSHTDPRFEDINRYSLIEEKLFFGLVYQGQGCDQAIHFASVPSIGASEPPLDIERFQTDGCTRATDPVIATIEDGWIAVWSDSDDTERGLFFLRPGVDSTPVAIELTKTYLTSLSATSDQKDAVIAWISEVNDRREIRAERLDQQSEPITIISDPERYPQKVTLHRLYDGFALVWFDMSEANKGLYLAVLDQALSLLGPITRVTPYVDSQSAFDLLSDDYSHTLLYSTAVGANREIRLRRFNESGEWIDKERYIVAKPEYARDASLDSYGSMGYIVAYRSAPDALAETWTIRMSFVTRDGRPVGETHLVAEAAPNGGRVTVRTSADGIVIAAWIDATAYDKRLRVIRIRMGCNM